MSYTIDYRNFGPKGDKPNGTNPKWWEVKREGDGEAIADSIATVTETLRGNQNKLEAQRQASARLYGNIPLYGTLGISSAKQTTTMPIIRDRLTYNIVQSCIDTVTSIISVEKPKPLFLTSGGDYKIQRRAKKLNQVIDGIFFDNKVHAVQSPMVFRDSAILGDGITHVYDWYGQVKHERVLASEIMVDEVESIYGQPSQLFRFKNVDRGKLAAMFPKWKDKIMVADEAYIENKSVPHISDQVTVVEAWHLPSAPDSKDGRHAIAITGCTLAFDDYEDDFYPFAKLPWCKRLYGYWSQGGAEQIQNIQLEVNKLLWMIQRSMHLAGTFKILVKIGSKMVSEHFNNDLGVLLNWAGDTPPQYITPPIIQPELYAHLATLKQAAYEQFGISELSASSKKPEGLDSGKSIREYLDNQSMRFQTIEQQYAEYHLELAKLDISTIRKIHKRTGKFTATVPGAKFLETIDWKDVDLPDDQYVMQVFPVSSLPDEPAGRLATIQEYAQAGYIDARTARKLSDFPDLQQVESLSNAVEERILSYLDKIVDEGEYTPPDQYMDLQLAKQLVLQYYNQFSVQSLEADKLDMLTQFSTQIDALIQAAMPPPMPQPQPAAVPNAPPQSDLIPNVPQGAQPPIQ